MSPGELPRLTILVNAALEPRPREPVYADRAAAAQWYDCYLSGGRE
jgi:hypothetical protein